MCYSKNVGLREMVSYYGRGYRALRRSRESIFQYTLCNDSAKNEPVSFQACLPANSVRIDTRTTPLKCEKILCRVCPSVFPCRSISELEQVKLEHQRNMDGRPTESTPFLHEDILARTLEYEQDLRQWRISELKSGRGDPGRPEYEEASTKFSYIQCPVLTILPGIRRHFNHTTPLPCRVQSLPFRKEHGHRRRRSSRNLLSQGLSRPRPP